MNQYSHLVGRILIALIFIIAGAGKLMDPAGTAAYMQSAGVPTLFLWPTIALELLGGIAIVLGFQTRIVSYLLAFDCVAAAVLFHMDFSNQMQQILFLKNLAIAGGFLLLASSGATALAVDKR